MTFGQAIAHLRAERPRTTVARAALGKADQRAARHLANYISRIEADKVPNVGLPTLKLLARGFGFANMRDFFGAVETLVGGGDVEIPHGGADVSDARGLNLAITGGFAVVNERLAELIRAVGGGQRPRASTPAGPRDASSRRTAAGRR